MSQHAQSRPETILWRAQDSHCSMRRRDGGRYSGPMPRFIIEDAVASTANWDAFDSISAPLLSGTHREYQRVIPVPTSLAIASASVMASSIGAARPTDQARSNAAAANAPWASAVMRST